MEKDRKEIQFNLICSSQHREDLLCGRLMPLMGYRGKKKWGSQMLSLKSHDALGNPTTWRRNRGEVSVGYGLQSSASPATCGEGTRSSSFLFFVQNSNLLLTVLL